MKISPVHIKWGVILILGLVFLTLLFTVFNSFRKGEKSNYEELVKAKDEVIKATKAEREAYQLIAEEKEKNIVQLKIRDSLLNAHYTQNQQIYRQLDAKLNQIPAFIARIANNDDSIRAAFRDF